LSKTTLVSVERNANGFAKGYKGRYVRRLASSFNGLQFSTIPC